MKMLAWAALALTCLSAPAVAQEEISSRPLGWAPKRADTFAGPDGKAVTVSAANPLPSSDPANASYLFGVPMTSGATYPLATNVQRAFYAICTAAGTVTLTDTSGTTVTGFPLSVGVQYHPIRIASFSALTGTCSIGLLK